MKSRLTVVALSACACAMGATYQPPRGVAPHLVGIEQFAFSPAEQRATVGDTLVWLNRDGFTHTTTADSAAWSSPELRPGDRFAFVAAKAGRFPYHCAAHPVMRGVLIVSP